MTATPQERVAELIFGAWKGRVLYAGLRLGLIDGLAAGPKSAAALAGELSLEPSLCYRLLRAMASIGLLRERHGRSFERAEVELADCERTEFELTEDGRCLLADHPRSLRAVALLQQGPEHTAIWRHLEAIVRDGLPHGFAREYGRSAFEHIDLDPGYATAFHAAMNSYSAGQTKPVLEALQDYDLSKARTVCDIGGGYGYLLCGFLEKYPHLTGTVLERPGILADTNALEAGRLGLAARCRYVEGDMFADVPPADLYLLKLILHDWADADAVRILACARRAAPPGSRLLVIEHVVPGPETAHFAKLYDIHIMCWGPGRERTSAEYAKLMEQSCWRYVGTRAAGAGMISLVEGAA